MKTKSAKYMKREEIVGQKMCTSARCIKSRGSNHNVNRKGTKNKNGSVVLKYEAVSIGQDEEEQNKMT